MGQQGIRERGEKVAEKHPNERQDQHTASPAQYDRIQERQRPCCSYLQDY